MDETGLYTVVVAVVGTATVEVYASSEAEARAAAESCTTVMHVDEWTYWADEVLALPSEQPNQLGLDLDAV